MEASLNVGTGNDFYRPVREREMFQTTCTSPQVDRVDFFISIFMEIEGETSYISHTQWLSLPTKT